MFLYPKEIRNMNYSSILEVSSASIKIPYSLFTLGEIYIVLQIFHVLRIP